MALDTYYNDKQEYVKKPDYHLVYIIGNNLYNSNDGNDNSFFFQKTGYTHLNMQNTNAHLLNDQNI